MRIPFFGTDPRQQRIDADAVTIADLTTKLKAATLAEASMKKQLAEEKQRRATTNERYVTEIHRANRIAGRLADAHRALRDIKRMATPHCAHIGRKMAARADEALPEDMGGHPKPDAAAQFKPNGAGQEVRANG